MPRLTLPLTLVMLVLGGPTAASATVHTGSASTVTGSLAVAYDDQEGTVMLRLEESSSISNATGYFNLGPACDDKERELGGEHELAFPEHQGELGGSWTITEPFTYPERPQEVITPAKIEGQSYLGTERTRTAGVSTVAGPTLTLTFASPEYQRQRWTCLTILKVPSSEDTNIMLGGYPAASTITVHRASSAQLRALTSVANARHADGFTTRAQYLRNGRVTSNGWADAEQRFRHPANPGQRQRGTFIVFHDVGARWRVVSYGSAVCEHGEHAIPTSICTALSL